MPGSSPGARLGLYFNREGCVNMNDNTRNKALGILENMRTIASADMMRRVGYISEDVIDKSRVNAVCRGHQACAVGSLWLAAGVEPQWSPRGPWDSVKLPGVDDGEQRERFLRNRPALRTAYKALNESAAVAMSNGSISPASEYSDPLEQLFESDDPKLDNGVRRTTMLKVIAGAKRRIKVV